MSSSAEQAICFHSVNGETLMLCRTPLVALEFYTCKAMLLRIAPHVLVCAIVSHNLPELCGMLAGM